MTGLAVFRDAGLGYDELEFFDVGDVDSVGAGIVAGLSG